jgi:hypothetical protein
MPDYADEMRERYDDSRLLQPMQAVSRFEGAKQMKPSPKVTKPSSAVRRKGKKNPGRMSFQPTSYDDFTVKIMKEVCDYLEIPWDRSNWREKKPQGGD